MLEESGWVVRLDRHGALPSTVVTACDLETEPATLDTIDARVTTRETAHSVAPSEVDSEIVCASD